MIAVMFLGIFLYLIIGAFISSLVFTNTAGFTIEGHTGEKIVFMLIWPLLLIMLAIHLFISFFK